MLLVLPVMSCASLLEAAARPLVTWLLKASNKSQISPCPFLSELWSVECGLNCLVDKYECTITRNVAQLLNKSDNLRIWLCGLTCLRKLLGFCVHVLSTWVAQASCLVCWRSPAFQSTYQRSKTFTHEGQIQRLVLCIVLDGKHGRTWAPAGIFPEGDKTAWTEKNDLFFGAPKARTKMFTIFSAL